MKKMISALALVLMTAPAMASDKPVRFANGSTSVTKTWVEKTGDTFEVKTEKVCVQPVRIPVYIEKGGRTNPDIKDMTILDCKTTDRNGKHARLTSYGAISYGTSPEKGDYKAVSASYAITESEIPLGGNWASFVTLGTERLAGEITIPAPFPTADADIFKLTGYTVSVSFEDKQ